MDTKIKYIKCEIYNKQLDKISDAVVIPSERDKRAGFYCFEFCSNCDIINSHFPPKFITQKYGFCCSWYISFVLGENPSFHELNKAIVEKIVGEMHRYFEDFIFLTRGIVFTDGQNNNNFKKIRI